MTSGPEWHFPFFFFNIEQIFFLPRPRPTLGSECRERSVAGSELEQSLTRLLFLGCLPAVSETGRGMFPDRSPVRLIDSLFSAFLYDLLETWGSVQTHPLV